MKIIKGKTSLTLNNQNYSFTNIKNTFSSQEVEKVMDYLKSNLNSSNSDKITLLLSSDTKKEDNKGIEISYALVEMALQLIQKLVEEKQVIVFSKDQELTTQQAADYLNVSRPYVIKLIEEGKIPFRKVGTHRRIKFAELIKYDNLTKEQQLKGLTDLTKQAQELNLGYE